MSIWSLTIYKDSSKVSSMKKFFQKLCISFQQAYSPFANSLKDATRPNNFLNSSTVDFQPKTVLGKGFIFIQQNGNLTAPTMVQILQPLDEFYQQKLQHGCSCADRRMTLSLYHLGKGYRYADKKRSFSWHLLHLYQSKQLLRVRGFERLQTSNMVFIGVREYL